MKLFKNKQPTNQPIKRVVNRVERNIKIEPQIESFSINHIPESKLRVGYYSTWEVACGIAVYTEHLYNALKNKNIETFVYSNKLSVNDLINQIDIDRVHVLNLQYEPAIMPSISELIRLIDELHKKRIKVFATFHSEPLGIERLINALDGCIYHKTPLTNDFQEKKSIIPMGVPVYETKYLKDNLKNKYFFKKEDKIISTTGFMFTWKQHASILELIVPFLKQNKNYKVQLLTAFNDVNPDECKKENLNIQSVISKYELQDQVIHITSFLSQQELSERLYISDIGYLWGAISTSSSSAAGKEFITSRLPLVVTESNHYHDLKEGVIKTPIDKNSFITTIFSSIENTELLNSKRIEQEKKYNELNNNSIIDKHISVFYKC